MIKKAVMFTSENGRVTSYGLALAGGLICVGHVSSSALIVRSSRVDYFVRCQKNLQLHRIYFQF